MKASKNCYHIIKGFETLHDGDLTLIGLQPKLCPAGVWTEGYGHAIVHNGKLLRGNENKALAYKLAKVKTEADADILLKQDVMKYEAAVNFRVNVKLNQNQFDALTSFTFNVGIGNLQRSTLLRKTNLKDFKGAAEEFPKWNKANKKVLLGLTRRRAAERNLFETSARDTWIAKENIPQPKPVEKIR